MASFIAVVVDSSAVVAEASDVSADGRSMARVDELDSVLRFLRDECGE